MENRPTFEPHEDFNFDPKKIGALSRQEFIRFVRESHDHMRKLSSIIERYGLTLDEYLDKWDGNLESFDDEVKVLLSEWMADGTLDHIINENIMSIKADKSYVDDLNENVTARLEHTVNDVSLNKPKTLGSKPNKKPLITFIDDDGDVAAYDFLYPIFKDRGIPCSLALITSWLDKGSDNYLSRPTLSRTQVKELISEGWEMLGHTHDGHSPNMSYLSHEELIADVAENRRQLELLGSKSRGFVYPQGNNDEVIRYELQKHFDFSFGGWDNHRINKVDEEIKPMNIYRVGLGAYSASSEFAYFKERIDYVYENGGWLVFMLHVGQTGQNGRDLITQVVDYVVEKEIEVVNASEGYEVYGSKLFIGDQRSSENKYINVDNETVYSNFRFDLSEHLTHDWLPKNSKTPLDTLESFKKNSVSVMAYDTTFGQANNFPNNRAGILHTYRYNESDNYPSYDRQVVVSHNGTDEYVRYAVSSTEWSSWKRKLDTDDVNIGVKNQSTNDTLPNAYPSGITVEALSASYMREQSFPVEGSHLLTTVSAEKGTSDFVTQELKSRDGVNIHVRGGNGTTWSAWRKVITEPID